VSSQYHDEQRDQPADQAEDRQGRGILKQRGKSWFFGTADYAFGTQLQDAAANVVTASGGKILGSVRVPLATSDFSSFVLQAQNSGAQVLGLANAGDDFTNSLKTANQFGVTRKMKPAALLAFITDIRRQNMLELMMYKALFEMAPDRADFISVLFSKPRPPGIDTSTSIAKIWEAYRTVASDSVLRTRNYVRVVDRLIKTHGFTFTQDESDKLKAVFDAFYYYGPSIATRGLSGGRGGDFADLTGSSNDRSGQPRSFLSSEENYQYVKSLHEKNLIVPVSGDFAGPKAIRAIAAYLKTMPPGTQDEAGVAPIHLNAVGKFCVQLMRRRKPPPGRGGRGHGSGDLTGLCPSPPSRGVVAG
jgi:hypothetical protein